MVPLAQVLAQNAAICAQQKRHQPRALHTQKRTAAQAVAAHLTVTPQLA
jgi:hypothetical protein